jgi:hypothetical protein
MDRPFRVYLDSCALCRLFDARTQPRVRQEAEAVEFVLRMFAMRTAVWVISDALTDELHSNPVERNRNQSIRLLLLSSERIHVGYATSKRAREGPRAFSRAQRRLRLHPRQTPLAKRCNSRRDYGSDREEAGSIRLSRDGSIAEAVVSKRLNEDYQFCLPAYANLQANLVPRHAGL